MRVYACWLSFSSLLLSDITVLLSLTVFMNLVSAIMPTTSDAVPLIGRPINRGCCRMFRFSSLYMILHSFIHCYKYSNHKNTQQSKLLLSSLCCCCCRCCYDILRTSLTSTAVMPLLLTWHYVHTLKKRELRHLSHALKPRTCLSTPRTTTYNCTSFAYWYYIITTSSSPPPSSCPHQNCPPPFLFRFPPADSSIFSIY